MLETPLETDGGVPSSPSRIQGGPAGAGAELRPTYRHVLRNRPFLLLWVAQLVSQSGDFVFQVALIWLVLELTGSAFAVGVMVTGAILPGVLIGPFVGVFVDRWDRRRTLVATNLAQGIVVAALSGVVLLGFDTIPVLFGIVFLLGTAGTTIRIASTAFVPSVVPTRDLPPANGLLSLTGSVNQIVGLSLGGIVVALLGVVIPIEYDAAAFFVAAILLSAIPRRPISDRPAVPGPERRFASEFREGIAFIRGHRFVIELLIIGVFANFFANAVFALFAPFSLFILHGSAATYGLLGAAIAVGSLAGALAVGRLDLHRIAGQFVFVGGVAFGLGMLGLGLVHTLSLALPLLISMGVMLAVINVPISVVLQAKIPHQILGRVGSTFGALINAMAPVGPFVAGWMALHWSVSAVFLLSGAAFAAVLALGAATMTSLRSVSY